MPLNHIRASNTLLTLYKYFFVEPYNVFNLAQYFFTFFFCCCWFSVHLYLYALNIKCDFFAYLCFIIILHASYMILYIHIHMKNSIEIPIKSTIHSIYSIEFFWIYFYVHIKWMKPCFKLTKLSTKQVDGFIHQHQWNGRKQKKNTWNKIRFSIDIRYTWIIILYHTLAHSK